MTPKKKPAKKPARKRLPKLRTLRNKADYLWSVLVLLDGQFADPWQGGPSATCQVCRERPANTAHHIFHRSMHARVRFDRRNGLPVCQRCHFMERRDPAPTVFAAVRYQSGFVRCNWLKDFVGVVMDTRGQGKFPWNRERLSLVILALQEAITAEATNVASPADTERLLPA